MIHFSKHLKSDFPKLYSELSDALDKYRVKHSLLARTKDYWCRDFMPFPLSDGRYLRYTYNPDYLRDHPVDYKYITDPKLLSKALGLDCIETDIILDGGNIVRCGDKIVMVDKVYDENPQYRNRKEDLKAKLEELLKAEVIFLPWDKPTNSDSSDGEKYGHSDGVVRYIGDGKVLLTNYKDYNPEMHERFRSILREHFQVEELSYTQPDKNDESWAYINFLQTGEVIILPGLGIQKDAEALAQMEQHYPSYAGHIVQIDAKEIIAKGGAFNCISWNS